VKSVAIPRTEAKIAHNKFIVLTRNDKPIAVWTGSTNLSRNAIYGQLNVGHAIDNAGLAKRFLAYWQELKGDPASTDLKAWTAENDAVAGGLPPDDLADVFSPHSGAEAFAWYKEIAASARKGLFMTFPFGIVKDFRPIFDHKDGVIRCALLEKYVNGGSAASRQQAIDDTIRIRRLPNVGMALGNYITVPTIDGWLKERGGIGTNVNWVHTKFMLVDPLGADPIVITGSANWSLPSVKDNDENMVVIRGETRVADIYFTEFMRIFAHHRFRESIKIHLEKHGSLDDWKPQDLFETSQEWVPQHFKTGSEYALRRAYFAG
jgi:phosphatidylserine/phosphatidylglycerophosphate/cardiolipin synthase-like enzyme